jgi:putative FmdB family regulatory protein
MPTYEFRCPTGHDFEKFYRSISAAPAEVLCPTCGKVAARQLSAGGGLLFKGSGFYITDYGKDGKKSQAPVTSAGEAGTKSGGEPSGSKSESSGGAEKVSSTGNEGGSSKPAAETKPAASSPAPSSKKIKNSE